MDGKEDTSAVSRDRVPVDFFALTTGFWWSSIPSSPPSGTRGEMVTDATGFIPRYELSARKLSK